MALEGLRAAVRDPAPLLDAWGLYVVGKTQQAFRDQSRGGDRWPPRAVPNRMGVLADLIAGRTPPARRWERRPAAIDTGRLRSSIAHRVEGSKVVVGSSVEYATDVQRGGTRTLPIPKRELAAWLRSLRDPEQRETARAAFGPLFNQDSLTVEVQPRPYLKITPEDAEAMVSMARRYFGDRRST